jgi:hypothetical protein
MMLRQALLLSTALVSPVGVRGTVKPEELDPTVAAFRRAHPGVATAWAKSDALSTA